MFFLNYGEQTDASQILLFSSSSSFYLSSISLIYSYSDAIDTKETFSLDHWKEATNTDFFIYPHEIFK